MDLTDRQRAAVEAAPGSLFVVAAAGSGKTRVLTHRFVRLAAQSGESTGQTDLGNVAAVTFTDKAAGELVERIRGTLVDEGLLGPSRQVERAWIGTIHGLCSRILRRHAVEAGLDPAFSVADEVQAGVLRERAFAESLRALVRESEQGRSLVADYDIVRVAEAVRRAEDYLRSLGLDVNALRVPPPTDGAPDDDLEQLAAAYAAGFADLLGRFAARYEALKGDAGTLDFEDLQLNARVLLVAHPEIASLYRKQFLEVMVDEFQDTNELQVSVIEALAGERIASVGDEKQSIYGWRHADVEVFRRRAASVAPERRFPLPENFRSHPELVSLFNGLFSSGSFWPDDFMRLEVGERSAGSEAGPWPDDEPRARLTLLDDSECKEAGAPDAEPQAVAEALTELAARGVPPGDMVVLLRAMTRAEQYASALRTRGIPVFIASGGAYFDTPEADQVRALLEVMANSENDEAFVRLLTGPAANVSDDTLLALRTRAGTCSLWSAAADPARPPLPEPDEHVLARVVRTLETLRHEQGRLPLYDLVHRACEQLDLDLALLVGGDGRPWANVLKFARLADEFECAAPGDPTAFLEYLDLRAAHARYEQQAATSVENVDAVRIMSVHAAKGLEFPVVALPELGKRPLFDAPDFDVGLVDGEPTLGVRLPKTAATDEKHRDNQAYVEVAAWRRGRELDEAKRLFYVAATRAERALLLFARLKPGSLESVRPIDWLLPALGLDEAEEPSPGVASRADADETPDWRFVSVGDAQVAVRWAGAPIACGGREIARAAPLGVVRGPEPPSGVSTTLERARTGATPERLSFSALERFRTCGYQYYCRDVLGLRTLNSPPQPDESRLVGTAVHEALRLAAPDPPPRSRLEALARQLGLDVGAVDRIEAAVRAFAESELALETRAAERCWREAPFAVAIGATILDGSMDLIAWSGDEALIVDYKTGSINADSETIARWKRQAGCYALASIRAGAARARVVFAKVEQGCAQQTFDFEAADELELTADIANVIELMARGEFEPLEAYSVHACASCPALGSLCPVTRPRRRGVV